MKKVVIIGGGGTGLATGMFLTEMGREVVIYEGASVVGGLAGSETIDGMYFDYGPHIYHTHSEETKQLWKEKFGDLLIEMDFYSLNYLNGRHYEYPLSYEMIEKFPPELRDRVKRELSERSPEKFKRALNFKQCLQALLGPTLEEMFFDAYSAKLWGIPTDQMSASWAPKRIEIRTEHKPFWYNQYSASPIYGSGSIMSRMADQIRAKGNAVLLNKKVESLSISESNIESLHFADGSSADVRDAIVVSSIPIVGLCDIMKISTSLEFASYWLVFLVFNRKEIFADNVQTFYFSESCYAFHRATEQRKYSDHGYPDDKTLLCFEISRKGKESLAALSEHDLVQLIMRQFCSTGMVPETAFVKGFVRTFNYVNPIVKVGYEEELARVKSRLSAVRNLHSVGGSAEFKYGDLQVMFSKARDLADLLSQKHYVINKNIKAGRHYSFNEEVSIYGYKVGKENPSLIIAEIGLNHNGDLEMGKELITQAKKCGADLVKIQTYTDDGRVSETAKGARYADKTLDMEETSYEMFKRLKLSRDDHIALFRHAAAEDIPILSTPFDESSVDLLMSLGVKVFKIASFDIVNIPLVRYIASKGLPIILSTGMSSLATIEDALDAIAIEENPNVILLHCVSAYPSVAQDVNLRAMETMKKAFCMPVGYSDHTVGNLIADLAMGLGAHVIEKHFTLNRNLEGTDHILSMDPSGLQQLVYDRETIFSALGSGVKRPAPSEYEQINAQRKSLFSSTAIKAGEALTLDNVTIKGPGHGLMPRYLNIILGKKAVRDIQSDSPIIWDDLLGV